MRSVRQFGGQILSGEVLAFVETAAPLGAIGDVVDDSGEGDIAPSAALAVIAAELLFGEGGLFVQIDFDFGSRMTGLRLPKSMRSSLRYGSGQ